MMLLIEIKKMMREDLELEIGQILQKWIIKKLRRL